MKLSRLPAILMASLPLGVARTAQSADRGSASHTQEPAYFRTGTLDFESRVWAQAQIERVYYNHRIWPTQNRTPKPEFERMVSNSHLEQRVTDAFIISDRHLSAPGSTPVVIALQAEMNRLAAETRDPGLLRELFAALHDDAFLIAETLARNTLSDANRYHDETRFEIPAYSGFLNSVKSAVRVSGIYILPVIADSACPYHWQPLVGPGPAGPSSGYVVWTGVEMIITSSFISYTPATNILTNISTVTGLPSDQGGWTTVWTGSDVIIFGGGYLYLCPFFSHHPSPDAPETTCVKTFNTGSRYSPLTRAWTPTPHSAGSPPGAWGHSALWSGAEMIIWTGSSSSSSRYAPATNSWHSMAAGPGAPSARASFSIIWADTEMIVWGGYTTGAPSQVLSSGSRYNPDLDIWTAMDVNTGMNGRAYHTAVWTGTEMIIWGGRSSMNPAVDEYSGSRYNPVSDSWSLLPVSGSPSPRERHAAVWSGSEMIVWGGYDAANSIHTNSGVRYDPVTDAWTLMEVTASTPVARRDMFFTWDSTLGMLIWGGRNGSQLFNNGGLYAASPSPIWNTLSAGKSGFPVIVLYWPSAAGAASYNIKRCDADGGACLPASAIASTPSNSYSEPLDGHSSFYLVEAVNACGTTP